MKKKSEAVIFGAIILSVLIGSILIFQEKTENKYFIGDNSTKIFYPLNCNIQNVKIEVENIIVFNSLDNATNSGFNLSNICN